MDRSNPTKAQPTRIAGLRLVDLNPRWLSHGGDGVSDAEGRPVPLRERVGVTFDCPCRQRCSPVSILFANPIDGGPPAVPERTTWRRAGETFEHLSLAPSIRRMDNCRWHGHVVDGAILDAKDWTRT